MAKRQRVWATGALARLRIILGNRCARCGKGEQLEFDCIVPQGHVHHAAGKAARACFYRRMARMGNLQILCSACHVKKTAEEMGFGLINSGEYSSNQ